MRAPRYVTAIAIIILLWNLMGVAAFVMQYQADPVELARTDPSTAKAFAAMPGWAWAAYAVAVGAGTLGAILLLAKKAAAAPLFLVSLIAVLVQFGYTFLGTDLVAEKGLGVAVFPALIIIVAIVQLLYARSLVTKRVLR
jgi:hypothetical protein